MSIFLKRYLNYHRIVKPLIFVSFIGLSLWFGLYAPSGQKTYEHQHDITIYYNDISLQTQIAESKKEQQLGLSYRHSLKPDEAMLFVYQEPGYYGFHMPHMNFPIDIFWLNKDKEVVFIKENADPDDFPEVYIPTEPAFYVLETVAGFANHYSINKGQKFIW